MVRSNAIAWRRWTRANRLIAPVRCALRYVVVALAIPGSVGAQTWTLEEQLRIGDLDGASAITRVGDILQSADGRLLFVSQPADNTVRVFDARTGTPLNRLGRRGSGPGEFQRVGALSVRGDTLFVADPFQQRMVKFSASGEHLQTFSVVASPVPEVSRPPLPFRITPRGQMWAQFLVSPASVARGSVQELPVLIMDHDGRVVRRVASVPLAGTMAVAEFGGRVVMFIQPFDRVKVWDVAGDGSAAAVATIEPQRHVFWITRFDERGDTVFHRGFRFTAKEISGVVRDSILSGMASSVFERAGAGARAVAAEHVVIPGHYPPVTDIIVGASGRTWVRREASGDPASWVVLDESGAIEATVSAPADLKIHHVQGDLVWGVEHDELDVPYVVRLRLRPGARPEREIP